VEHHATSQRLVRKIPHQKFRLHAKECKDELAPTWLAARSRGPVDGSDRILLAII